MLECLLFSIETSPIPLPRIVGHEGISEIVQLGEHAGEHLKMGDTVGVPFIQKTCLHCEFCLSGRGTVCEKQGISRVSANGCFATKLPEGMDPFTSGPLFCAVITVYKALKVSKIRPGQ